MNLKIIIDDINTSYSKDELTRHGIKAFIAKYYNIDSSDVNWIELCNDVKEYGCYKYGFLLMIELLSMGLYKRSHSEKLYSNLYKYKQMNISSRSLLEIMCGDKIEQQIIYTNEKFILKNKFLLCYINTNNGSILEILEQHFKDIGDHRYRYPRELLNTFGKSLGIYEDEIQSACDFTASTLFQQTDYYNQFFVDNLKMRTKGLRFLVNFYRWLVRSNPNHSYFKNEFHMSEKLLFSNHLLTLLEHNYYITTLNPANIPYGKKRICFILKGFENESTAITSEDYVSYDLSRLTNDFYRDLLIEFIVTSKNITVIRSVGAPIYIREAMEQLYQLKQQPFYPNKKLNYLTNQEAVFIRQMFYAEDVNIATKNNKIGALRRFVSFCLDKNSIAVDDLFFEYLTQYEEPNKNTAKTVSDTDLAKLSNYLSKKGNDDLFYKEMFVIFHLAIQTEFRINQICHLQIDCIRPTIKPNQFEIVTNSKTSYGRKKSYVISAITYNLLMDIINETDIIRENCPVESMKQYIFIYNKSTSNNTPVVFNDKLFSGHLINACSELNIERYTASNLRDTHMTKALEHIMRNGKSEMEMSVLSKHKYMDTTKNHYIEMELEKMLESTYGITIGAELIETDSKVLDDIPAHLQGIENDTENGCGKCSAEICVMVGPLPCLACKYFITTVKHEMYFKKAIDDINRLIKTTTNRHDKEDLITIKELYVLYLKAIIKHKEGLKYVD